MRRHPQNHLSVLSHTMDSQLKSPFLLDFSFIKADHSVTGLMDGACVHVSLWFNYAELNIQGTNVNAGSEQDFRKICGECSTSVNYSDGEAALGRCSSHRFKMSNLWTLLYLFATDSLKMLLNCRRDVDDFILTSAWKCIVSVRCSRVSSLCCLLFNIGSDLVTSCHHLTPLNLKALWSSLQSKFELFYDDVRVLWCHHDVLIKTAEC